MRPQPRGGQLCPGQDTLCLCPSCSRLRPTLTRHLHSEPSWLRGCSPRRPSVPGFVGGSELAGRRWAGLWEADGILSPLRPVPRGLWEGAMDGGGDPAPFSPAGAQPRKGADTVGESGFYGKASLSFMFFKSRRAAAGLAGRLAIFASIYLFWSKGLNQSS